MNASLLRPGFALVVCSFLLCRAAFAADYHVAPVGKDSNPGTYEHPWANLTKANATLRPGDTVHLRGGRYPGQQIKPARSGTADRPIRYIAHLSEQPVLTDITFIKESPGDARFRVARHGVQSVAWYQERFPDNFRGNLQEHPRFISTRPSSFADFELASGSPQINRGAFLTHARMDGGGVIMPVEDAGYFSDGFEVVPGDLVQLEGTTEAVRITRVDYERNELHLERALRWEAGQGVSLAFAGQAPDMGAFEHGR